MPRHCTVCHSPSRHKIDAALLAETHSLRDIAHQWSVSKDALIRHKSHIPGHLAKLSGYSGATLTSMAALLKCSGLAQTGVSRHQKAGRADGWT